MNYQSAAAHSIEADTPPFGAPLSASVVQGPWAGEQVQNSPAIDLPSEIGTQLFAEVAGITTKRAAAVCSQMVAGTKWRKLMLDVVKVPGRGGSDGVYRIFTRSLPQPMVDRLRFLLAEEAKASGAARGPRFVPMNRRVMAVTQVMMDRYDAIKPALDHPYKSSKRKSAVRQSAVQIGVSTRTIYNWVEKYLLGGIQGLADEPRSRSNVIHVSRDFDRQWRRSKFDENSLVTIGEGIQQFIADCWSSAPAVRGKAHIRRAAVDKLKELCREKKLKIPTSCMNVSPNLVNELADFSLVALEDLNPSKFRENLPRIRRTGAKFKPMQYVYVDVKFGDVWFVNADGVLVRVASICFYDVGTERLFSYFLRPRVGETVSCEEVLLAFLALADEWGLPQTLHFDQGNENKAWFDLAARFAQNPELEKLVVIRARANNPQAKSIEPAFSRANKAVFSQIPGFSGDKAAPGFVPRRKNSTYRGSFEQYCAEAATLLAAYHNEGRERSPGARYDRFKQAGFSPRRLDDAMMAAWFGVMRDVMNRQGKLQIDGKWYTSDELCALPAGQKVKVVQRVDGAGLPYLLDGSHVLPLHLDKEYSHDDPAGFAESERRQSIFRARQEDLRRNSNPVSPLDIALRTLDNRRIEGASEEVLSGEHYVATPSQSAKIQLSRVRNHAQALAATKWHEIEKRVGGDNDE